MKTNIEKSWKKVLQKEFNSDYFINIKSTLINEQKNFTIYPPSKDIFKAFNTTPFDDVKVVIIGQDPYHGIGQAHGLSFSVQDGIKFPPSLENIFKELKTDLNIPYPANGNLTSWAKQGVLLLNASLTVRESDPNSHQNIGWQKFTDSVIQQLSEKREGIIFLLWGGFAKKKGAKIDRKKHHILTTGHPSPLSANRGYWFGNKHFSKTNKLLISMGKNPIDWNVK
ncbi:uracil-DNA glycosylase [Vicingus serpentipes]|uniref:Uracil-DNA glycosylase n=1 Tax=Vicingus serpentipes TaxID=1926625 RepID=A0A5C6RVE4_9FLAO|nr:uracil-DNA glycosylase [Vicingus serpentipes]TXB65520.1 uracil-DNA glycosylase [Vicingus serpentipes]